MSARTLVLDTGFRPHRIIKWQRAVLLLFQEKAQLLETYDEPLATPRQKEKAEKEGWDFIIKIPAVIRLLQRVKSKKAVRFSRINILTRDKWRCCFCGEKFSTKELNYDHVIPRSQGGKTTWENIVSSCYKCNSKKGDRTPEQAGMTLRSKPYKPKNLPIIAFHIDKTDSIPEAWRNWLYWNSELESDQIEET